MITLLKSIFDSLMSLWGEFSDFLAYTFSIGDVELTVFGLLFGGGLIVALIWGITKFIVGFS